MWARMKKIRGWAGRRVSAIRQGFYRSGLLEKTSIRWLLLALMLFVSLSGMLLFNAVYGNLTSAAFTQMDLAMITEGVEKTRDKLDDVLYTMLAQSEYMKETVLNQPVTAKGFADAGGSLLVFEPNLQGVFLLDGTGNLLTGVSDMEIKEKYSVRREEWFADLAGEQETGFSAPHIQRIYRGEYPWVVSLVCPTSFLWGERHVEGYLVMDVSLQVLKQLCETVDFGESGYLYITDEQGGIIYHPWQQSFAYKNIANVHQEMGNQVSHRKQLEFSQSSKAAGWVCTGSVWEAKASPSWNAMRSKSLMVLGICIFLSVVLSIVFSKILVRPIQRMEKMMERMEENTNDVRLVPRGPKEFVSLAGSYNMMLDKVDSLMKESEEKQKLLRNMEVATLQEQVNPHFLYNTLDSIVWILEADRNQDAIHMLEALARLLRLSIHKGGNFHKVQEEVEHCSSYLLIQQRRLGSRFSVDVQMQPGTEEIYCPKIILQPIVENAIKYGIGDNQCCTVQVRVWLEGENLHLSVRDDGIGITPKALEKLNAQLQNGQEPEQEAARGIGMRNVNRRIRLLCGQQYGISIDSEQEEWTCVTYTLPVLLEP